MSVIEKPPAPAPGVTARRPTVTVPVGPARLGSAWPIAVQAMADGDTGDAAATAAQVAELARAGAELVRLSVSDERAARAVPEIRRRLDDQGVDVPLVGDFHFNGHRLLEACRGLAAALAKYRVNPGTVGGAGGRRDCFRRVIAVAREHDRPVRIGANLGSLERRLPARERVAEALVDSVVRAAEEARELGLPPERIVLSAKASGVIELWQVYRQLARRARRYPLHLGLSEAGPGLSAVVDSTAAVVPLLAQGIGDTLRVSLTPGPGRPRTREVELARAILQSVGARAFRPKVTACPGCGRTDTEQLGRLAWQLEQHIVRELPRWRRRYEGVERLKIAVMGCAVNGPGEARQADVGVCLPARGGQRRAEVFVDGVEGGALRGELFVELVALVERYLARRSGRPR